MEIFWYGQAFFKLKGKTATVMVDPFDPDFVGLKFPKDTVCQLGLSTHDHKDHNNLKALSGEPLLISGPGEYEKSGVSVAGVTSFHDDKNGAERGKNTIYSIFLDGINVIHLGDLGHELVQAQLDEIDNADILLIPVGGVYTINAEVAAKVVAQLEPKIVIPMHYKLPQLKFELDPLELFLKEMGAENITPVPKLSAIKDKLPEETTVIVLNNG